MPLIIGIVTFWKRGKKCLQESQRIIHVPIIDCFVKKSDSSKSFRCPIVEIARQKTLHQAYSHFLVGDVEGI